MKRLTKIGCGLIGWDHQILSTCGEASKRQFRKLLSAISIMMILWGTIGYCFAENYLGLETILGRIGVAIAFMVIILCIERVIILNVGKNWIMALMRGLLALCMAILGASIFDQLMFKNDIQQEISNHREDVITETVNKRLSVYDSDIMRITKAIDSISSCNDELYKQIEAKPTTTVTAVSTSEVTTTDTDGRPVKETLRSVNKTIVPNPRIAQAQGNEEQIKIYTEQLEQLRQDKKDIDKITREEINSRPTGFIEELEATIRVISGSWVSLTFYCIMFAFLIFLELFVLTIKIGEKPCDYELIVEHQLSHKRTLLQNTEDSLNP